MSIRLDTIVSAIAHEAGLDPDRVSQDRLNIVRWVNDVRREVSELPISYSALEFVGEFQGVLVATAGTVAATQYQAEVTGTSTSFATAMNGRYISIASGGWQRIAYVTDTTHLTLETPWGGSSTTSSTYKIWKRDYQLPAKVNKIKRLVDMSEPSEELAYYDPSEFYQKYGMADEFSQPVAYTQFGSSRLADAFIGATVFTVTVTAGSPIVDFSSAVLSTAVAPGDRLTIGNSTTSTAFYVDHVLTDTKLALTQVLSISTGTTSATAASLDRLALRFWPAVDSNHVFMFEAQRKMQDIFNNADILEDGWYNVIRKGAIAKAMGYVGSPRETAKLAEYQQEIANLIRSQFKANNPSVRMKPHIPYRYSDRSWTVSDRDI